MIATLEWPASTIRATLLPGEVHLWAWSVQESTVDLADHLVLLDATELRRFHAFHFAQDRGRYAVAHGNMRRILGGYRGRHPADLCLRANSDGKPEFAAEDAASALHFSLSHSQRLALLAVAHGQEVGVDVEDMRPIEAEVAEAHFSTRELSQLSQLYGDAWLEGFYRCWTRKEAILKAEGVGLHFPLDSFDVSLIEDAPAELQATRQPFRHHWSLYHLTPAAGAVGALAVADRNTRLACFSFRAEPG